MTRVISSYETIISFFKEQSLHEPKEYLLGISVILAIICFIELLQDYPKAWNIVCLQK